ncbi:hypothetical protein TrVE_jg2897 [Triparma verrucosa]|uniref:V-SNARE coiled-coil homology domain-containing protein n=1 Tax=Triparma verrucosa TaxID=1606542 RepID=A0A9W7CA37_9STRA|nr:hypothetical protein TrVE_jg2897 [Triparma verrucosa]
MSTQPSLFSVILFTLPVQNSVNSGSKDNESGPTLISRYDGSDEFGETRFEDVKEIVRRHPPPIPTLSSTPTPTPSVIVTSSTKFVYSLSASPPGIYCIMLTATTNFDTPKMQEIITRSHEGLVPGGKVKNGYGGKPSDVQSHLKSLFKANCHYVSKISDLNEKLDNVKATMSDNIGVMLENSEKVTAIESTSAELQQQSLVFKKKSTKLKKVLACKNRKMTLIIIALALVIIGIIVAVVVINVKASN